MSDTRPHDEFCEWKNYYRYPVAACQCAALARARADERERIAQAMADSEAAAAATWRLTGESYYEGRRDAYDVAEQVARNGGES